MKILTKILTCVFLLGSLQIAKAETLLDFDGDGKTDYVVIRRNGTIYEWHISRSSDGVYYAQSWGFALDSTQWDKLVPADYDGDGKTDAAVWRRSDQPGQSAFYILNSSDQSVRIENLGEPGDLLEAVGDYDGDGRADPAVYRRREFPQSSQYIYRGSLNNPGGVNTTVNWGKGAGYFPYRGDFDGDGKFDFCVRSGTTFLLKRSSDNETETINFGNANDILAPGDYDGDGRTDFCVMRYGKSNKFYWHILERDGGGTGTFLGIPWGEYNSLPEVPFSGGDFDGDGRADIGVYSYEHNSQFEIRRSSDLTLLAFRWGSLALRDQPIQINYY